MRTYTIVGGVNGAGKSSLSGVLKAERSDLGEIIDVDKLAIQYGGNVEGGKAAIRMQAGFLQKGLPFTQETTLSGRRPLRMIKEARAAGYYIRLFYVGISTAREALLRIQNRVAKGGHDVPRSDVLRRFEGRFEALAGVLDCCDEAFLYDNENGFVLVAEYKNGIFTQMSDEKPLWFGELTEYIKL